MKKYIKISLILLFLLPIAYYLISNMVHTKQISNLNSYVSKIRETDAYKAPPNFINNNVPLITYEGCTNDLNSVFIVYDLSKNQLEEYYKDFDDKDEAIKSALDHNISKYVECYLKYDGDFANSNLKLPKSLIFNISNSFLGSGGEISSDALVKVLDGNAPLFTAELPTSIDSFGDTVKINLKSDSDDFNFDIKLNKVK